MAKSFEQHLQDQLGAMAFTLASLTAQLEAAREEIAALKAEMGDTTRTREVGPRPVPVGSAS